jgi:hypothetical protein
MALADDRLAGPFAEDANEKTLSTFNYEGR